MNDFYSQLLIVFVVLIAILLAILVYRSMLQAMNAQPKVAPLPTQKEGTTPTKEKMKPRC